MAVPIELIEQAESLARAHEKELRIDSSNTRVGGMHRHSLKHSLYGESVELADEISTHYVWGADASHLIQQGRPYEPDGIKEYRHEAYEQETFPHGQRIIGLIKGALSHPQLFSIDFPVPPMGADEEGEKIEDYVFRGLPLKSSSNLNTYFWEFIFQMLMVDPNGYLAVLQKTPDFELVENPDQFRDPYPEFIPSSHILDCGNDYCLVVTTEEIEYKENAYAPTFFYFTKDVTLKLIPVGEYRGDGGGVKYEAWIWHEHYYGEMQIRQVGGLISGVKNSVLDSSPQSFHLSHLQATIPAFNKVVRYLSDLDAMFVAHMHPIKVEELTVCQTCNGLGRVNNGQDICGTCNGSKVSSGSGVLEGYVKASNPQTGKIEAPVMFISPDPRIFSEARAFVEQKLIEAYEGVNAAFLIKKSTGQQEAARSRELHREPLMLFFRQVAGTVFPLYQWVLDMINRIRYEAVLGRNYEKNRPIIIEPANYDTSILDAVIDELVKLKDTTLPASVVNRVSQNAMIKRFGAENQNTKLMVTYLQVDPLANYTSDDILTLSATGNITKEQEYIHTNIVYLVDLCLKEDDTFLEWGEIEKREKIAEKAKEEVKKIESMNMDMENIDNPPTTDQDEEQSAKETQLRNT